MLSERNIKEITLGKIGIYGFVLFVPISLAMAQMSIGLAIAGWFLKMVRTRSFAWKKTPLDLPILIYVITQIIAVLHSRDISTGLGAWINTDWFILFYYATINIIDSEDDLKWIPVILAVSGSVSAIYGIVQHFMGFDYIRHAELTSRGDFYRARGFFSLPLTYGGIQLGIFIFLFPFALIKELKLNKSIFRLILILLFASILASYARSAWLGFSMFVFLSLLLIRTRYTYFIFATIAGLFVLIYFIHPDLLFRHGVLSMFDMSENAPYNNLVRMKLWESTWALICDNWLFGIGYSHFGEIISIYKIPFNYGGLNDPHNDFLKVMALSGLTGITAYMFLWIIYLNYFKSVIFKSSLPLSFGQAGVLGSTLAIISFLTAGLVQEYYHDAEIAGLWWFFVALGIIFFQKFQDGSQEKVKTNPH